ncbi:hypothetical protein ACN4EK_28905 [Pantanalinema rosaneae CENA516]|uniref:hypothetical protein n=1 Tax=Pantanalinema rosaneae TaxID=1620701 RepID=UPI003D6E89F5
MKLFSKLFLFGELRIQTIAWLMPSVFVSITLVYMNCLVDFNLRGKPHCFGARSRLKGCFQSQQMIILTANRRMKGGRFFRIKEQGTEAK